MVVAGVWDVITGEADSQEGVCLVSTELQERDNPYLNRRMCGSGSCTS